MFFNKYEQGKGDFARLNDRVTSFNLGDALPDEMFTGTVSGFVDSAKQIAIIILDEEYQGYKAIALPVVCLKGI